MTPASVRTAAVRHRILLTLLVLTWAVSWPVIKIGVSALPPLWYGVWRYLIAAACLFAVLTLRREVALPPRPDWPLVAVSGALQMGAYSALTGLALTVLSPGRASVLAFSTPIWVVPLSAWWLHEHISWRAVFGVVLGVSGVFAIAAPSIHLKEGSQIVAYALLMAAAAIWAIAIVFVRAHAFTASALSLAPWQMLVAAGLLLPLALLFEGGPTAFELDVAASLAYVGPVATAFAYWAVVQVGRHVRASSLSMALLATPSLGILISALTLGEKVEPSLGAGVILIGAGIWLTAKASSPARSLRTARPIRRSSCETRRTRRRARVDRSCGTWDGACDRR
jgi:drug/metabolite transporter (DMT)-like permease